jgi:hypothetical protein
MELHISQLEVVVARLSVVVNIAEVIRAVLVR